MSEFDFSNAALLIAHPAHELRVFGWMKEYRPAVYVLTDGSGRSSVPRIERTRALIRQVGATETAIFGNHSDREIYELILNQEHDFFIGLADVIAMDLVQRNVGTVVGDAAEQVILTHDVWRMVIDTATRIAECHLGRNIPSFSFPLEGAPNADVLDPFSMQLDDGILSEKMSAAFAYEEIRDEVDRNLLTHGFDAFRGEHLDRVPTGIATKLTSIPQYENYGKALVADGVYDRVVRYEEHVVPIAQALQLHASQQTQLITAS